MRPRPFVPLVRGALDAVHIMRMGKARGLFEFLIDRQTNPDGLVNYGRPITYKWIQNHVENGFQISERTWRRWMESLRSSEYVSIKHVRQGMQNLGIIVRICNPKKWARQLRLFGNIPVQKPVEKLSMAVVPERPLVAAASGQMRPLNSLLEETPDETNKTRASRRAPHPRWREFKARRIEAEVERLRASLVGAGPSDQDRIERVRARIDAIYARAGPGQRASA